MSAILLKSQFLPICLPFLLLTIPGAPPYERSARIRPDPPQTRPEGVLRDQVAGLPDPALLRLHAGASSRRS